MDQETIIYVSGYWGTADRPLIPQTNIISLFIEPIWQAFFLPTPFDKVIQSTNNKETRDST